jgi:hypothetical protein
VIMSASGMEESVGDWSLGPLMACSLHLDDIRDEKGPRRSSDQNPNSAAYVPQSTNLKDQIKLFQLYVSACELNSPRLEDSDSSDESIHHGRDSCASSKGQRGSKSGSSFDSFLLKPRDSIRGAFTLASTSLPTPPPDEDRRQTSSQNHERCSFTSLSFSDAQCPRVKPTTSGSFKRGKPQCDSQPRSAPAEYDVYKTQLIKALNSGKPVWL